MHPHLVNRFDYDSDYGTVLNRFLIQAANGIPLTVYGIGGQTRAFIHLKNAIDCMVLAINNPPESGDRVKIFNQMTETKSLNYLVDLIRETFENVEVSYIDNPRNELAENDLKVVNKHLGLQPIYLASDHLKDIYELARKYSDKIIKENVYPTSFW